MIDNDKDHIEHLRAQGLSLMQQNRLTEAKAIFEQISTINARDADACLKLSSIYGMLGDMEEAGNCCRRVIELQPDNGEAYLNLGNVLFAQGSVQDAIEYYQHARKLNSSLFAAYRNLGIIFSQLKRYDEALAIYDLAISLKLDFAETYYNRGNVLHQLKRYEDALVSYDKAISLKPDYLEAYDHRASVLGFLGRVDEAVTSLRQVVKIAPGYAEGHQKLGMALAHYGKREEAVISFRQALEIQPNLVQALNGLGKALLFTGRVEEAKESYDRALKLKPDANTFYHAHTLLIDTDNMSPAIEYMKAAVKLAEQGIDFYKFFLGMLLDYAGDVDSADLYLKDVRQGSDLQAKAFLDAWNYIKSANKRMPRMIGTPIEAFRRGIEAAPQSGLMLEFGVRFGGSIRQIAGLVAQDVCGFDSFEGLPEAWHTEDKGSYTTNNVMPEVPKNVRLYKGWFENTLPEFLKTHSDPVRFMNIDCDIYSSTKTILDCLSSQIVPGTIIVFDEYIGTESWREDEYKAFQEAVDAYGWKYEYLAFSFYTKQVVVRLL